MPRTRAPGGSLGRALQRKMNKTRLEKKKHRLGFSQVDVDVSGQLTSVTETSGLEEFLSEAVLADKRFIAEKQHIVVLDDDHNPQGVSRVENNGMDFDQMSIPRRPKWDKSMTADELHLSERKSFLEWRKSVAEREDAEDKAGHAISPFEKNLEVWKQLWRVVERSDVIAQVVDGRNPLLYRCADVETYVKEVDPKKRVLLIVNKSDFLSEAMRTAWQAYFKANGIDFIFFSAKQEQKKLNALAKMGQVKVEESEVVEEESSTPKAVEESEAVEESSTPKAVEESEAVEESSTPKAVEESEVVEEESSTPKAVEESEVVEEESSTPKAVEDSEVVEEESSTPKAVEDSEAVEESKARDILQLLSTTTILNREEILEFVDAFLWAAPPTTKPGTASADHRVVGMIGYPNVGKSSLINVLLGINPGTHTSKRVAVSSTPGKTKHFQTLFLSERVELCDCPGLVFPLFMSSKADMVCAGMLPIDQMRGYISPIANLCNRIPRKAFELTYGMTMPLPPDGSEPNPVATPRELLSEFAIFRGFMSGTHSGPDQSRAARQILKDFVNGVVVHCTAPPRAPRDVELLFAGASVNAAFHRHAKRLLKRNSRPAVPAIPSGAPPAPSVPQVEETATKKAPRARKPRQKQKLKKPQRRKLRYGEDDPYGTQEREIAGEDISRF